MRELLHFVVLVTATVWCSLTYSQMNSQIPGQFGFQGIMLNTHFSKTPPEAINACVDTKNGGKLCAFLSKIAEEECLVHLAYIDQLLWEITVYFPEPIYSRVAAAMQSKYWSPDVKHSDGGYEWWAKEKNSLGMPAEKIFLFRKLTEPTKIDKHFFKKSGKYSWIMFEHSGPLLGQQKRDMDRIKRDL